jgi:uncharacterized protein DUF3179
VYSLTKRLALVFLPVALVALVAVPILIDQPFGSQTTGSMAAVFMMRRWSPVLSLGIGLGILALVVSGWRRWRGLFARAGLVAALVVTAAAAWFARQNPFEWMFNPLAQPRYVAADAAPFVADADLVLAVTRDGDAAAYPIRQLAYHHVINDRIGTTPAVVTY